MIRRLAVYYLLFMVAILWGFAIGRFEVFPFRQIEPIYREVKEFVRAYSEQNALGIAEKAIGNPQKDRHDRFKGKRGFIRHDPSFEDKGYILLSRYSDTDGQSVVELISAANGEIVFRWIPDLKSISALSESDDPEIIKRLELARFRTVHPLAMNDGGLIFNPASGPLIRIDACGKPRWLIDGKFHHSIERDSDGNIWVAGRNAESHLDPPIGGHVDDTITLVSPDGEVLFNRSVSAMLVANGLRGVVYQNQEADNIHLNDIHPLSRQQALQMGSSARAGDVILSMRTPSAIALYRPSEDRLIWMETGPWLYQHDPDPLPDGRISLFGNDIVGSYRDKSARSAIYFFDPATGGAEKRYEKAIEATELRTATEGRLRILDNGDAFVEEQNFSRLLRFSETGVRWSYVNAMRNGSFGYLHWSRYLHGHEAVDLLSTLETVQCGSDS